MRRLVAIIASTLCLASLFAVFSVDPVGAAGNSSKVAEFNICSRHCTEDLPVAGATNTNYGLNPVAEFRNAMNHVDWPRIISLTEVELGGRPFAIGDEVLGLER